MKLLAFLVPVLVLLCPKTAQAINHYHFALIGAITEETGKAFERFILEAKKDKAEVTVEIDSPGGDSLPALSIYNGLRGSGLRSTCTVRGMAASGAFLVLQGCSVRLAVPDAQLITHRAYAEVSPPPPGVPLRITPEMARKLTDSLETLSSAIDTLICRAMKMDSKAYMAKVANGQTWEMTAVEALGARALDRVLLTE